MENNQCFKKLLVRLLIRLVLSSQPLVDIRPVIIIAEVVVLFHGADQVGCRAIIVNGRQLTEEDVLVLQVVPAKFYIMDGHIFEYVLFLCFHILFLDR